MHICTLLRGVLYSYAVFLPLKRLNLSFARRTANAKPMPEEHPVTKTFRVPIAFLQGCFLI